MIRSLAGRNLACVVLVGLLIPWAMSAQAQFEPTSCLGAFEEPIRTGGTNGVRFVVTGDLNGDCATVGLDIGCLDVVIASAGDDRIAWFENRDTEFFMDTISTNADGAPNADGATAVVVADLNGDCATVASGTPCLDVVSASSNDNKIAWYRNNGNAELLKFEGFEISTDASAAQAVYVADINGDCADAEPGIALPCLDVLSASYLDNKIAWYENEGQRGVPQFTEHVVTLTAMGASSVYAADMDDDGDMDIISASILDDKISWWEQVRAGVPVEITFIEHVVTTTHGTGPVSVVAADLNHDCNEEADASPCLDILVAFFGDGSDTGTGKITWFRNDGATLPGFTAIDIKSSLVRPRQVIALAPDGDVLAAHGQTISWFPNTGTGPGDEIVVTTGLDGATGVHAADLDGDGVTDVLSASSVPGVRFKDDKVLWYRNDSPAGALPTFPDDEPNVISVNAASFESIVIADIDDDCDPDTPTVPCLDLVSASSADNTVAWHQNDGTITDPGDGGPTTGPGFTEIPIDRGLENAWSVFVADLDGDCPDTDDAPGKPCLDVIAAAPGNGVDGKIVWYRNELLPDDRFSDPYLILEGKEVSDLETDPPTSENAKPMTVFAADINGDCAAETACLDVIAAVRIEEDAVPDEIVWFENGNQDPPDFTKHVIPTNIDGPYGVHVADINGDCATAEAGEPCLDILVASTADNRVTWLRNDGVEDPVSFTEIVVTTAAVGAIWVSVTDLNDDCGGDDAPSYCKEILSASSGDNKIAWYEVDAPEEPPEGPPAPAVGPDVADTPPTGTIAQELADPQLVVMPATLNFGDVFAGQVVPATLTLTIKNDAAPGGDELVISSITSTTANFALPETHEFPLTLAPQVTTEISVIFRPTAVDFFHGTLEFASNAVDDPPTTVPMSGKGLQFVVHNVATNRQFARFVSAGDVDDDGDQDILAASSGDGVIAAYLQQEPTDGAEDQTALFEELIISADANDARVGLVTDLNADSFPDVATAFFFGIAWHEGHVMEICNDFDVDDDQRLAGAELGWIWTSFGESYTVNDDEPPWFAKVDYEHDGLIDGDDLAIATSLGVWTRFVSPQDGEPRGPLCNRSCVSQD